jgi:glycosyltransferase involved in cell wall biosynthesis
LVADCDLVITLGVVLLFYPSLCDLGKPLVADLYNPFLLENLQRQATADLLQKVSSHEGFLDALRAQIGAADFFVCADEKQRDYWLGVLSALGRVNPYTHHHDSTLRCLIDVVPFGLPDVPPQHTRRVLKGVYKTIGADDKVILWGGGIWNWLDALTLIRAMRLILGHRRDVKLFFMGIERPNVSVVRMEAAHEAIGLSKELGLYDRYVFFNDWVPYAERQNFLLEADIGASLHRDHIETRFSFRTRLLDYIWAGLPTIATAGDVLSKALADDGLARLVAPGDVKGVAETILSMLGDRNLRAECAPVFRRMAGNYRWDVAARPLLEFCASPYLAPDKDYLSRGSGTVQNASSLQRLLANAWRALRLGGTAGLVRQTREYVQWRMNK